MHSPKRLRWGMVVTCTTVQALVALVCAPLVAPVTAEAQQAGKVFQIGYLGNSTPALESALVEGLRQGLRENGYIEGQNIVLHYRWAEGEPRPCRASPPSSSGSRWMSS